MEAYQVVHAKVRGHKWHLHVKLQVSCKDVSAVRITRMPQLTKVRNTESTVYVICGLCMVELVEGVW